MNGSPAIGEDDAVLLAAFVGGDEPQRERVFAELVRRHAPMVAATCRRWLSGGEAEDATQAVFLVLAQRAGTIRTGAALPGWLHQTAWNVAQRAAAAARTRRHHEREAAQEAHMQRTRGAPEGPTVDLDSALVRLPEDYRTPIVLHYLEGLPQAEVARRLGVKENTIAMRLSRGRSMLRERLERLGAPAAALSLFLVVAAPLSASEAAGVVRMATVARDGSAPEALRRLADSAPWPAKAATVPPIAAAAIVVFALVLAFSGLVHRPDAEMAPAPPVAAPLAGWSATLGDGKTRGGSRPVVTPAGRIACSSGSLLTVLSSAGVPLHTVDLGSEVDGLSLGVDGVVYAESWWRTLIAIDTTTGAERWRRSWMGPAEPGPGRSIHAVMPIPGGPDVWVMVSEDGHDRLLRLDGAGATAWSRDMPPVPPGWNAGSGYGWTLAIDRDGRLLAGRLDGFVCSCASDGSTAWTARIDGRAGLLLPLADGGVVVASSVIPPGPMRGTEIQTALICLSSHGEQHWNLAIAGYLRALVRTPAGEAVYCRAERTTDAGYCGLVTSGGERRWERLVPAPMNAHGAIVDRSGDIVVAGSDGWLQRLDSAGRLRGRQAAGGLPWGLAQLDDGRYLIQLYGGGAQAAPARLVAVIPDGLPEPR